MWLLVYTGEQGSVTSAGFLQNMHCCLQVHHVLNNHIHTCSIEFVGLS